MRKKIIKTDDMSMDEKKELREELKEEYEYKLHLAEKNLPELKEKLKSRGYTLTDDYKVYKIVDGVAVWLNPVAALNVINGDPEVTRQDKNRMIWSLRKEGKLKTPFFERSEVRALIVLCFVVVGFPFMAFAVFNISRIFVSLTHGEYNSDYYEHREEAIKNGTPTFNCHNYGEQFIPTNETDEERKIRYKNQRSKTWEEFYDLERCSPAALQKSSMFYLTVLKFPPLTPKAALNDCYFIVLFTKEQIAYFFSWLSTVITTSDLGFSIDEKYEVSDFWNDIIYALLIPFVMGPFVAAFLYPVTIVIASVFLAIFLPRQEISEICMTEEEMESAKAALAILAAKSVLDSSTEIKRRRNNPVKFDD